MSERGSSIDNREVLERRQLRMELPTEKELLRFFAEHEAEPGWNGITEAWERERERGAAPFFENASVRAIRENDVGALETARAFINYLDERLAGKNREPRKGPAIAIDKANAIRDRLTAIVSDRDLAKEIALEFDGEVSDCNLNGACEKILRRMEVFIKDCSERLAEMDGAIKRDRKKRALADELWRLQLSARAIRNDLLHVHFENPQQH
jgi:hypothetical protein